MIKHHWKAIGLLILYAVALFILARVVTAICADSCIYPPVEDLILSVEEYHDDHLGAWEQIKHRIRVQPFNIISLMLFGLAICHTFFSHHFTMLSKRLREKNIREKKEIVDSFGVGMLHFMGEVEVIFGIWIIPLFFAISYFYGWRGAVQYVNNLDYIEPTFVVVIMALASTRPIIKLAEDCLRWLAGFGKGSSAAWWWVILTIGPLSGSLITEPGAMTISALLLAKHFYELKPSLKFSYGTLGLLFTNISVGGVFSSFAAPPVLLVSRPWEWNTPFMFFHFGWKAMLGILLSNLAYYFIFRPEFNDLERKRKLIQKQEKKEMTNHEDNHLPFWVSFVHVFFLAWTVVHKEYPVIFIGTFLLFLGFYQATMVHQSHLKLKPAVLVGFFLAGLVVHGSLQSWWIAAILGNAKAGTLFLLSAFLTSFNDNAEITFMATLIPNFNEMMKYAVVAGAVTGGGLTVIANAPNPSGQSILSKYFPHGISASGLLKAAAFPTVIVGFCFYLFRYL